MKFFIPATKEDQYEDCYNNSIIRFIESQGYDVIQEKRIYSITYQSNGELITDTVGRLSPLNEEAIFAILETKTQLLVCTKFNGMLGGEPINVEKNSAKEIEYFENSEKNIYKYGDWTYKLHFSNHLVEFPKELPKSVFKYYNNNEHSKDALLKQYLFCSHPYHLNDSMDCTNLLWDFSKISKKIYDRFIDYYVDSDFVQKKISFEEDLRNNFEFIKTAFWNIVTNKSGIISLSENPLHSLMWSHYASEKGFMVEFDRAGLIDNFKKKNPEMTNYVFMPVQYVDKLEQIDFFSKDFNTPDIPFLYSINIKKSDWKYEDEWRLVSYSQGYGIPNSILIPGKDYDGKVERKFFYEKEKIESFTLGKYFFNGSNLIDFKCPNLYVLKQLEVEFINFIYENFNDKLYISDELEKEKQFLRNRIQIRLNKLDENVFEIVKL